MYILVKYLKKTGVIFENALCDLASGVTSSIHIVVMVTTMQHTRHEQNASGVHQV